jgi:hypothetical protein
VPSGRGGVAPPGRGRGPFRWQGVSGRVHHRQNAGVDRYGPRIGNCPMGRPVGTCVASPWAHRGDVGTSLGC